MKKLPSQNIETVDCGSELLEAPQVDAIEKAVREMPTKVIELVVECGFFCLFVFLF